MLLWFMVIKWHKQMQPLYVNMFYTCSVVLNHYFLKIHYYSSNVAFTHKDCNIFSATEKTPEILW